MLLPEKESKEFEERLEAAHRKISRNLEKKWKSERDKKFSRDIFSVTV